MDTQLLYLKQNVQVEPLIDQWYAWSQLIPPATLARNITERHLKIMDSYISTPAVHAMAVKNPKLLGGPFIDYQGERVDEIRALRDATKANRRGLFELSNALVELDTMLQSQAKGYSLNSLYPKVPACLRGFVELVYDLNNHPSYRLLEPFLYKSRFYDDSLQSLMLSPTAGDERPFALSTPRLGSDDTYTWDVPFSSARIDEFFQLKSQPKTFSAIRDIVGLEDSKADLFRSFFSPDPPKRYERYEGPTARWRYFGHACVLIETADVSLLFDPVLSYTYDSNVRRYTYLDLPEVIDYVLITHNHQDHILLETLLQLRHKIRNVVVPHSGGTLQDPSIKLLLKQIGLPHIIELTDLEEFPIANGSIAAIPFIGEHCDLDVRSKMAYMVRVGPHSLLFAADSCNLEPKLYEHLHDYIGDVDALFLGMECVGAPLTWLYGPLFTRRLERAMDNSRRLAGSNYEQAIRIVDALRCKEVYVYAMGQEPWLNYVMSLKYTEDSLPIVESKRLIRECHDRGIIAERLFGEKEMFLGQPASHTSVTVSR